MTSSTILTVTCLAVTACVALFMVLSISLPQWYTLKITDDGDDGEAGLFKECQEVSGNRQCITITAEFLLGV